MFCLHLEFVNLIKIRLIKSIFPKNITFYGYYRNPRLSLLGIFLEKVLINFNLENVLSPETFEHNVNILRTYFLQVRTNTCVNKLLKMSPLHHNI